MCKIAFSKLQSTFYANPSSKMMLMKIRIKSGSGQISGFLGHVFHIVIWGKFTFSTFWSNCSWLTLMTRTLIDVEISQGAPTGSKTCENSYQYINLSFAFQMNHSSILLCTGDILISSLMVGFINYCQWQSAWRHRRYKQDWTCASIQWNLAYPDYSLIRIIRSTYPDYSFIPTHVWEPIMIIIYWESDSCIRIFSYPYMWLGNGGIRISEGPL